MAITLGNAPVAPRTFAPKADDSNADIMIGGQPNVGLFAWTTNDLTGIKDIITYVQAALDAATRAEAAAADAENTRLHIDQIAADYENKVVHIDEVLKQVQDLAASINVDLTAIQKYVDEAEDIRDASKQIYDQVKIWYDEIRQYQMLAVYKYFEDTADTASYPIHTDDATVQYIILQSGTTTFTITTPNDNGNCRQLTLMLQQGTGANKVVWPSSVRWNNGRTPVLSQDTGKVDVLTLLTKDSGAKWYGFYNGGYFNA